jgi:hypothetical protein
MDCLSSVEVTRGWHFDVVPVLIERLGVDL